MLYKERIANNLNHFFRFFNFQNIHKKQYSFLHIFFNGKIDMRYFHKYFSIIYDHFISFIKFQDSLVMLNHIFLIKLINKINFLDLLNK
jgi:hypothetical protein